MRRDAARFRKPIAQFGTDFCVRLEPSLFHPEDGDKTFRRNFILV